METTIALSVMLCYIKCYQQRVAKINEIIFLSFLNCNVLTIDY